MLDQVTHVELRRVEKDTRNNFVVYNQNVMFGSVLLKLNVQNHSRVKINLQCLKRKYFIILSCITRADISIAVQCVCEVIHEQRFL